MPSIEPAPPAPSPTITISVASLTGDVAVTLPLSATGRAAHAAVAAALGLPPVRAARLRLARAGGVVPDGDQAAGLADGDTVSAVFAAPDPPPASAAGPTATALRRRRPAAPASDSDDDDDDAVFRYAPPSSRAARALCDAALRAGAPPAAVAVASKLPRAFYATLIGWPIGAKLASWAGVGPVYVLASIIVLIYANLGTRRPGEASAYTVFNDAFRPLLGQFRAEDVDANLRRGGGLG